VTEDNDFNQSFKRPSRLTFARGSTGLILVSGLQGGKINENRIPEIKEGVSNTVKNKDKKVRVRNYSMELSR
jgi:hypothetical protein